MDSIDVHEPLDSTCSVEEAGQAIEGMQDNPTGCTLRLYEILVPCQTNEGKPIRTKQHQEWDNRVRRISGGLTVMPPSKGQWVYEGKLFAERMIPVRIMCTDAQMKEIVAMTANFYGQLAIMYYVVSNNVIIQHFVEGKCPKRKLVPKK